MQKIYYKYVLIGKKPILYNKILSLNKILSTKKWNIVNQIVNEIWKEEAPFH